MLKKHPSFLPISGPVLTVVMDGVGLGRGDEGDAVARAHTPVLDRLLKSPTLQRLAAHGRAVGLPSDADMGNSEVGHNALGAGRVFEQGASLIDAALRDGSMFRSEVWRQVMERGRTQTLHFVGLLSDGNVHSHEHHLHAMLREALRQHVHRVRIHILFDGRDVPPTSADIYLQRLDAVLSEAREHGCDFRIASGGGRMTTTMDRYESEWGMVERGYHAHVHGQAPHTFANAEEALATFRSREPGIQDQNLPAFVVVESGQPIGKMSSGDAVVLFNFRGDRAIEFCRAMTEKSFSVFDRKGHPEVYFAGMMQYDGDLKIPPNYLVEPPAISGTMSELLAHDGITQFACSETQKFGHVTYFWNGNRSGYWDQRVESYVEIKSDTLPFEERPWMKAAEITDATVEALLSDRFRSLRINFPNGDMVGHTGDFDAAVTAVAAVDLQLERLVRVVEKLQGALVVTADHGNAEQMFQLRKDGSIETRPDGTRVPLTSHTLSPVPFVVHCPSRRLERSPLASPGLANVAATVLQLLGCSAPESLEPSLLLG